MKKDIIKLAIVLFVLMFVPFSIPFTYGIYEETKSQELYLSISHPSFTVTFNPNNGTVTPTSKTVTYGHTYDELPTPERVGFTFEGWYDALNNGNRITSSTVVNRTENHTLFAHWSANELIINGSTNINLTYSTSSQTANIIEATNGTGNYTYTEKLENNGNTNTNYMTLSGTEITLSPSTPAGTYTYVVTVRDTVSNAEKDVTYTIIIGRMPINLPTCGSFTYNRAEQTFLTSTTEYTVANNIAINAGTYNVRLTPTSNYEWYDNSTGVKNVSCTISRYDISASGNSILIPTENQTYTGSAITPTPAVMVDHVGSISSYRLVNGEVSYSYANNINVGQGTITITGVGNYTGQLTQNFTIVKADGHVTLSETTANVFFGTESTTFTINSTHGGTISISDNNATVTTSRSGNTVTVHNLDDLDIDTTVVITVTSAATSNYNAATTTYTVKVAWMCKRATTLHNETCGWSSGNPNEWCLGSGFAYNDVITYGNTTTTPGVLKTGDAFDCDVDGDGVYDPEDERFYYVSDFYDASTGDFVSDVAALVYYHNTTEGDSYNSWNVFNSEGSTSWQGPVTAIPDLPTTTQWPNVSLYKESRNIVDELGNSSNNQVSYPTSFSYAGYAARFLTWQEIAYDCAAENMTVSDEKGFADKCLFLVENTYFSISSNGVNGFWLENAYSSTEEYAWAACGQHHHIGSQESAEPNYASTRPTIDIPKSRINY